jgi:hypothetical protein
MPREVVSLQREAAESAVNPPHPNPVGSNSVADIPPSSHRNRALTDDVALLALTLDERAIILAALEASPDAIAESYVRSWLDPS